eukprot:1190412-Prorocentrum_minimum.AAC.3
MEAYEDVEANGPYHGLKRKSISNKRRLQSGVRVTEEFSEESSDEEKEQRNPFKVLQEVGETLLVTPHHVHSDSSKIEVTRRIRRGPSNARHTGELAGTPGCRISPDDIRSGRRLLRGATPDPRSQTPQAVDTAHA